MGHAGQDQGSYHRRPSADGRSAFASLIRAVSHLTKVLKLALEPVRYLGPGHSGLANGI